MLLPVTFFARPAPIVASELLGTYLKSTIDEKNYKSQITEVEAYEGTEDSASHARRGRTPRAETMFGPPGILYVYLIYGMHYMLNVVTHKEGIPSAVLIRSTELTRGPGKLAKEIGITKRHNNSGVTPALGVWFESEEVAPFTIKTSPRIGVEYAGNIWANQPWRFTLHR